ncbi:hypothetical protein E2C01_094285 [Portunus trituberculatus]|uniref:Uncharacterized protein n=1 Tax=Portunus trituberculatus TaxID=210409 RepID=A0A5B7JVR2_PORTR|nr:hypothetical protein [Portunus trituberculatus]
MSDSDSSVEGEALRPPVNMWPSPSCGRLAKKQRDSGESYISVTMKRQVDARSIGAPCSCPNKCFEKI